MIPLRRVEKFDTRPPFGMVSLVNLVLFIIMAFFYAFFFSFLVFGFFVLHRYWE